MSLEELKHSRGLTGHEELTKDDVDMLLELEEEFARRGNFMRVYPLAGNVQHYEQFFEVKRYQNHLVSAYLTMSDDLRHSLIKNHRRISSSEV